ncbi:immunoglobulin-like domain-containing protein, partial [Clostridium sp.]|uniref:immunoglobulin-like domain-containing protein n=1 Tax=Clostridium sp. TaxID=1506 RepID=UPI00399685E9
TVSVISRSVSNDIEFYNKEGNENLFSLKYNPITNIFDVSKKGNNSINNGTENNPPSEEQPPQDQSPDESEQSSQGTDGELKAKTGNLSEGNNDTVQDNIPNEGNPDQDDNPSVENPPQDSNNSQDGEGPEGSNDREDNTEQPKKEIVFKLSIFNVEEKKVGEIELTEEETKNIEELKRKLQDITIYDNYYFSIWSNNVSRIKIKGEVHENNKLGEAGNEEQDYYQTITNKDYIDNVRFNLTEDGIHAVYNKAPKITITSKEMLTAYAGDIIDYTKNIEVKDDRDNEENGYIIDNSKIKVTIIPKEANGEDQPIEGEGSNSNEGSSDDGVDTYTQEESSTETEEEAFRKEEEKHLKIGKNTIRLTVEDSWGRATSIERNLLILNGIDKNEIIFKAGSGREPIRIKFNHQDKKLDITTQREKFGDDSNPGYVKIAIYRPNENGVIEPIVSEISINASDRVTDETLQTLKNYEFKYGDYFEIYHGHPQLFSITGGVNDQREDYTDGVQNPENLLNVKFEITKSGLKSIYTNPDENNISDNKVVFGPVAQEKFPFKIKIDFIGKKFKVIDATGTFLKFGDKKIVYKIALIRKERDGTTRIVRETDFRGTDFGKSHMSTENENPNFGNENKNWNGQGFEYNDCLYLWHDESNRSIIKGNIKDVREDYSNGVDDIDNMNNVVFRLTPNGLESIYNEAPKIEGVGDIDVYQNQPFNPADKVTYSDDHDDGHLTISISPNTINTSELGEKTISYTATDRWGKTTTVKRKVTVRPNLYKNVFKVYP